MTVFFEKTTAYAGMAKILVIKVAQHCCISGVLHRKVMMRALPGPCLHCMTAGTGLTAHKLRTTGWIAGKCLPRVQQ